MGASCGAHKRQLIADVRVVRTGMHAWTPRTRVDWSGLPANPGPTLMPKDDQFGLLAPWPRVKGDRRSHENDWFTQGNSLLGSIHDCVPDRGHQP